MGKKKRSGKGIFERKVSRRDFIKKGVLALAGLGVGVYAVDSWLKQSAPLSSPTKGGAPDKLWKWSREAYHYIKLGSNVQCQVCPNQCILEPGDRSICRVKVNKDGRLYTLAYGNPCAVHVDPIEKKPLYHYLPGSRAFSIATAGCNLRCLNCFVPETTIATENGLMQIIDIFESNDKKENRFDGSVVNKIDGQRAVTHTGEILDIVHGFKHPYAGDIFNIKPHYTPGIKCTPSHELFVYDVKTGTKKVRARELKNDNYLVIPKNHNFSKSQVKVDLKEILSKTKTKFKKGYRISEDEIKKILDLTEKGVTSKEIGKMFSLHPAYVRTLRSKFRKGCSVLGDNIVVENNGGIKFKTGKLPCIPRFVKLDKNFARLLGYYCGEGCVHKSKKRLNSYLLLFTFGKKEPEMAEETVALIKKIFKVKSSMKEKKTNITVTVCKSSLAVLFKDLCGTVATNKKVPNIIYKSPRKVVDEFLRAYIKCDGSIQKEVVSINSVSKELALGVYWLLLKMGFLPSFYKWVPEPEKMIEGRKVKQSDLYYVKLKAQRFRDKFLFPNKRIKLNPLSEKSLKFFENDDYYFVPVFSISKEKYIGDVYNLEVKGHHSYLANFIAVGNCQNWSISQSRPEETENADLFPDGVVQSAINANCTSIAYTYSEPTAFYDYMYDTAKMARSKGIKNLWITNGYINEEPLVDLCQYLDAANVDLKSFKEEIYNKLNSGRLQPVLNTLLTLKRQGVWFEITNLVVPTYTDDLDMIGEMCAWIVKNIGPDHPLHFSRFTPMHKLTGLPMTDVGILEKAAATARDAGIKFVYVGNVPGHKATSTYCPGCDKVLLERRGYMISQNNIQNGACKFCGERIAGVWQS